MRFGSAVFFRLIYAVNWVSQWWIWVTVMRFSRWRMELGLSRLAYAVKVLQSIQALELTSVRRRRTVEMSLARWLPKSHSFMGLDAVGKVMGLLRRRWVIAMSLSWRVRVTVSSFLWFLWVERMILVLSHMDSRRFLRLIQEGLGSGPNFSMVLAFTRWIPVICRWVYVFSPFIAHDLITSLSYWRLIDHGNYEFCGLSIRQWSVRIQEGLVLLFTVKLKLNSMSSNLLLRLRGPEAFTHYTKEFIFGRSIVSKTGDDLVKGGFLEIAQWGKDECGFKSSFENSSKVKERLKSGIIISANDCVNLLREILCRGCYISSLEEHDFQFIRLIGFYSVSLRVCCKAFILVFFVGFNSQILYVCYIICVIEIIIKERNCPEKKTSPHRRYVKKGVEQVTEGKNPRNQDMAKARSLVNKGLIKRVGSGTSISVWEDPWIPAQFPRPAKSNGSVADPSLKVNDLIDRRTNFWNIDLLRAFFDPEDVALISAIHVGAPTKEDSLGWHFTKSGKYTVKSGYHTTRLEKLETNLTFFGPDINPLKAHSWQVHCPPKIRHFLWQILTGCVPVTENLRRRGINCDTGCARCGAPEETINHTLFQCHPARQIWALSQIPTAIGIFPTESNFTNLDHLFWRIPSEFDSSAFPWIIWYIWKARNEKIFENIDTDPIEVLRLAEKEAQLWQSAQIELHNENHGYVDLVNRIRVRDVSLDSNYSGYRCFVDGSWKESDKFSGTGWFCTSSNGEPPTMGAANLRRSLSPLHAEVEALLWAMKCMIGADNQEVAFFTDCSDLVKMVSSPTEWPAFSVYLEEFQSDKEEFSSFSLSLISRRANVKADNLARKVRTEPLHITYVNNIPQEWLF
ncbi:Reverse transcriptase zinc-binding domain [Arabidopsis thaliana x Arabidopsis arenosa]|uniref:Reverse transcriptase zinc-binding domain n=1 Tax=Arabidopsis thaliana x Arabidopsis arenosa TaxID=1240361 RepID=A0A8T2B5X8_9BRAS|nr:Reverse transcriptase zinc-binding domain [Arabidopsis thaliana x Arabidopsis arenosa]